jgi:hypothetical protein
LVGSTAADRVIIPDPSSYSSSLLSQLCVLGLLAQPNRPSLASGGPPEHGNAPAPTTLSAHRTDPASIFCVFLLLFPASSTALLTRDQLGIMPPPVVRPLSQGQLSDGRHTRSQEGRADTGCVSRGNRSKWGLSDSGTEFLSPGFQHVCFTGGGCSFILRENVLLARS